MKKFLLFMVLLCYATAAAWSQNGCAAAVALTPGTQQCGNSAGLAGDFPNAGGAPENPCNASYNDDEYWFTYTHAAAGMGLDLLLSNIDMTWAGLFVLDSCAGGTTSCVAHARNSSSTADIVVQTPVLTVSHTYYIVISNWGTPNNTAFCLDAVIYTPPMPPPNDLCGGAIAVSVDNASCTSPTTIGTNTAATDSGEGAPCGSGTYNGGDVWYEFTMPASVPDSTLILELSQTVGSLYGEIYPASKADCGLLPAANYCSNFLSTSSNEIITSMAPNATYLLRLFESGNDASGTFEFCLRTLPPPPVNDSCSTATLIAVDDGECRTVITATNESATDSGEGAPCGAGTYSGGDIWFKITMPSGVKDTTLIIDLETSVGSMYGELYPDGTCGSLPAAIYCSNFLSTSTNEIIEGLTPGATYFLRMFESGNNAFGTFDFCLRTPPAAPANDLCSGAIAVPVSLDSCSGPTTLASNESTSDSGEGAPCGVGTYSGGDVWFEFTVPAGYSGVAIDMISTVGSLYGEVYEASTADCGALPAAVYCSNFLSTTTDELITGLTGGSTYLLRIFESGNNSFGLFEFCMYTGLASANDNCATAAAIVCGDSLSGSVVQWDADNGDDVGCTQGKGVWYEFTDASGGTATVTVDPATGYDVEIGVATSPDCIAFTNVGCEDGTGSGTAEVLDFAYSPGVSYYIYVAHFSNTSTTIGDFGIEITCNPCVKPVFALQVDATNCPTSLDLNVIVTDIGSAPTGVDIWDSKSMSVTQTNVGVGTYALTGLSLGDTVTVAVYDNAASGCADTMTIILPSGCPPANDLCSGAIAVTVGVDSCSGVATMGTNTNATDSGEGEPCGFGTYSGGDVWYSFTMPPTDTTVYIDFSTTFGSLYGEIYEAGSCGALAPAVYCSNFLSSSTNEIITGLTGGSTYLLRIFESGNNAFGTFEFCMFTPPPPPANDECATPGTLVESPDFSCANGLSGTTQWASPSSEDDCSTTNKDVWYTFVPSMTASYEIQVVETFDPGFSSTDVSIFEGACGGLTQVGSLCFNDAITVNLTASTAYLINVRSSSTTSGVDFDLCAFPTPPPPANDSCSMATTMMCGDSIAGSTISATGSLSSSCLGSQGNNVWYTFVGTGLETIITVDANTSGGFEAQIDLYQSVDGTCSTIYCIGGEGAGGNPVELTFMSELDTVYYIAVGEWISSGPEGVFGIELSCVSCAAPTNLAVSSITTTSAAITWDTSAASTGYIIEYGLTGFTLGAGTQVTSSSMGGPETISSLMAASTYDVYIYSDCGGGDISNADGPVTFITDCDALTPYYQDSFNTFLPLCWSATDNASPDWTSDDFGNVGSGPNGDAAKINLYTSSEDTLVSPAFDLSGGLYNLTFDFASTQWNSTAAGTWGAGDYLDLLVSEDGGISWSLIMKWTDANKPSNTGDSVTISLSSYTGITTFAFAAVGVDAATEDVDIFVDNFEVVEKILDPCAPFLFVGGTPAAGTFRAVDIVSNALIQTPKVVDFEAGTSVELNSNFEVKLGAEFSIEMVECP